MIFFGQRYGEQEWWAIWGWSNAYTKERIINEARQESAHLISHAEEISREKIESIKTQAQKEITELALRAAEKVIGKNVDSAVNEKLIDDFISELKTK